MADRLQDTVREAFVSGVRTGFAVNAALAGLGAVFAITFVRGATARRRADQPEDAPR